MALWPGLHGWAGIGIWLGLDMWIRVCHTQCMTNPFIDLSHVEERQPSHLEVVQAAEVPDHLSIIQDAQMHIQRYLSVIDGLVRQSPQDPDVQVAGAKAVTDVSKQAYETKQVARTYLWNRYGAGTHATPCGVKFSFAKPAYSRRVNYKVLEKDFPDVYEAVVKITMPGADTPGNLTIK